MRTSSDCGKIRYLYVPHLTAHVISSIGVAGCHGRESRDYGWAFCQWGCRENCRCQSHVRYVNSDGCAVGDCVCFPLEYLITKLHWNPVCAVEKIMLSLKNAFWNSPRSHRARFQYGFTIGWSENLIRSKRVVKLRYCVWFRFVETPKSGEIKNTFRETGLCFKKIVY